MRRARPFLALCLCALLALSGCGEPEPLPSQTDTPEPTPSPTAQPVARFSLGYDPAASLHPITGDSQVNQDLAGLVYQGLYELDNEFVPRPVLAASGTPGADGYSWTFTMKTGVVFSDGTPVTAQHAAASLNAARASGPYAARLASITGVAAADEAALTVYLSAPNGNLPALLDVPIVLEQGEWSAPLGTGYYRYEAAGERLYLQTNPYHTGGAALPYATIPLTAVTNANERIAAFDSGDITAVTTEFSDPYALGYSSSYETCDFPTTNLLYVGFKTTGGACQSSLVRQAFSRAFDRDALVQVQLSGHGDAACLPISPVHGDYDGEAAAPLGYDLEQAAALLAQAGYPDGFSMTITAPSNYAQHMDTAQVLIEQLKAVGITAELVPVEWDTWVSDVYRGRDYQSTVCGIAADDMTAREMLVRYMSDNRKNFIAFNDAEYDDVLNRAMASTDDAEQTELYKRAEEILNEKAASLWIQDACELVVMDPALDGFTFYRTYVIDMSAVHYK